MCGQAQTAANEVRINQEIISLEGMLSSCNQEIAALSPVDVYDRVDRANLISEKNEINQRKSRCYAALADYREALMRIRTKTYGLCSCGRKIESERLKARPTAKECEICASQKVKKLS